ncbi:ABC transporter permease [Inhella crocodyli]|jgi:peptide/nickel transport system permease protein|uniref:ABC transporter permease n=1 Tax=Inhella crocodyli TaxID=2499851 RepID=A0A437LE45_9BURK|nr:ABC transporter permease [Inhella crocodyli]RVT83633.1 ABC transporter permease [Inhella crocodyli]
MSAAATQSQGVWALAWKRLKADRVGMVCLAIVSAFALLVVLAAADLVAKDWQKEIGVPNAPPHLVGPQPAEAVGVIAVPKGPNVDISDIDPLAPKYKEWDEAALKYKTEEAPRAETLILGGDRLGRDILQKVIKGAEVSIVVGLLAALVATTIGTLLGAISGFFGGKVGDLLEWVYNVFTAIPSILLIFAFAVIFGRGILSVVMILGLTGWTGVYRLVRAEFMKHRQREYVRSAEAIGASVPSRIFKHILPNVSHVSLVQLSLLVVGFIKSEVILSYLGLGVSVDQVSWGTMLSEAQSELILGYWWQLAAVTFSMAVFVTAFALFTDALRDALDPKLRGLE